MDIIYLIRQSSEKNIIYSLHALEEMNAEDEMITTDEVRHVVFNGEILEDYPEDKRGHSCLMFGMPNNRRPVHVVCAPKEEYLAIITAYIPSLEKWEADFKTRRKK
ncbi:MAG: DUF4258 domain-containing protein [Nitrospira sp.]|nr:DUF4258 domain-containing protein [Nitrospira sp.]